MVNKYKKTIQDVLKWTESLTGVKVCVRDQADRTLALSQGFEEAAAGSSGAARFMTLNLDAGPTEWKVVFEPGRDEPVMDRILDFIKDSLSRKFLQDKAIESLSKEIVSNYGEINLFYKMSRSLLDLTDIQKTCQDILEQALERIPSSKASILLLEPDGKQYVLASGKGIDLTGKSGDKALFDFKKCILQKALTSQKPLFINDLSGHGIPPDSPCECEELLGKQSLLAVPMPMLSVDGRENEKQIIGIIILSDKVSDKALYTSNDLKLLISLASQLAVSISHWKVLERVQTSQKTLEETYDELMKSFESQQKHASLNEQMNQISKRISATQNIKSIFSALADYSRNLLRSEFSIAAYKEEDGSLQLRVSSGFKEKDRIAEITENLGPGPFMSILESGKHFSYHEGKDGPINLSLDFKDIHVKSLLGLPIFCHKSSMGVILVFNSGDEEGFSGEDRELLASLALQASTVLENAELVNSLNIAQHTTMIKLAELAERRDPETGLHLERMKYYSRALAWELKKQDKYKEDITEDFIESLFKSSPLHDIGKVGIEDAVLLKPGKLTPDEFEIMKEHATIGGEILEGPEFLRIGRNMALFHHEKYNGTGYPRGIKGEDIPLEARILSLADVYDALTSKRVYKDPFPFDKTYSIIMNEQGKAFDPDVIKAFESGIEKFKEIQEKYGD